MSNAPHLFSLFNILIIFLQILEVKPESKDQLPLGTRVCVYWSQAYKCLFPATIEEVRTFMLILLAT